MWVNYVDSRVCVLAASGPLLSSQRPVDLIGRLELVLEVFGGEVRAQVVDGLSQAVEGVGDIFAVGEAGVAPDVVGAAGKAQHVVEATAGEGEGQARFVGFVGDYVRECNRRELRQVRDDSDGPIVGVRVAPDGFGADVANERAAKCSTRGSGSRSEATSA